MSNILIADSHGRRRVQIEVFAQGNDHHTYSVGTIAEAMRYAEIYVPDILIAPDSLPDGDTDELISAFRASNRAMLRELAIITCRKPGAMDRNVIVSRNNSAAALVGEAENVLSRSATAA